jgi:hypothetical protein
MIPMEMRSMMKQIEAPEIVDTISLGRRLSTLSHSLTP